MLLTPFLTEIDPRSAVKGSRDPLGMQPIWTAFGRKVVGNLTTVSTSVRDFTIALLGYHFIEQAEESGYTGSALDLFIRWEQLASYARAHVLGEKAFRGTDRAHRNLADDDRVTLSTDRAHQILGNQKIYGIWGLYSVPARSSGLLENDRPRLTPVARAHGEEAWTPVLDRAGLRGGEAVVELLKRSSARIEYDGRDREMLAAIATLISPRLKKRERAFYRAHLVEGGPRDATRGLQAQLAGLLLERALPLDRGLTPAFIAALAKDARSEHGRDSTLAEHLERIRTLEPLLATCSSLFSWLLNQDGREVAPLSRELRRHWGSTLGHLDADGIRGLEARIAAASTDEDAASATRWSEMAKALAAGRYDDAIVLLLQQNTRVMRVRDKSAPWVELTRDGRLKVRFHDERTRLPEREELAQLWRYTYFIDSLRRVAHAVGGAES